MDFGENDKNGMGRPCKGNGPFRQSLALLVACPRGHRAADCLLAATPLRDSWCPVGASPSYGWGVPPADKSFSTNQRTFVGADILSARQRNFTNLLFPSAKRDPFSVLLVAACPAGATAQPLAAGCLLAAMPLRDSSYPVGAVPPYGWGVSLAGKITFLPASRGQNHFFFCSAKEKVVLDSEKEKVDRWK